MLVVIIIITVRVLLLLLQILLLIFLEQLVGTVVDVEYCMAAGLWTVR